MWTLCPLCARHSVESSSLPVLRHVPLAHGPNGHLQLELGLCCFLPRSNEMDFTWNLKVLWNGLKQIGSALRTMSSMGVRCVRRGPVSGSAAGTVAVMRRVVWENLSFVQQALSFCVFWFKTSEYIYTFMSALHPLHPFFGIFLLFESNVLIICSTIYLHQHYLLKKITLPLYFTDEDEGYFVGNMIELFCPAFVSHSLSLMNEE